MTRLGKTAKAVLQVAIVCACLLFLADRARDIVMDATSDGWLAPGTFWYASLAAPIFAITALFMTAGWRVLLRFLGHPLPTRALAGVLCSTQIAKYLPGNIGHHVGRVTLAHRSLGLPISTGSISLLQEGAVACLSALLVGLACTSFQTLPLSAALGLKLDSRWLLLAVIATGLGALTVLNILKSLGADSSRSRWVQWMLRIAPSWRATMTATPAYLATYALSGLALLVLSIPLLPDTDTAFLPLTSAYALSWMVGFLVPGAPGGLGVREATLVVLLDGLYPEDAVLAIALVSRLSMIAADILIFLAGLVLLRMPTRPVVRLEKK
jgi:hypothetical protein